MPAKRSETSAHRRLHPSNLNHRHRPASKSAKDNPDIIIVSSDDDDEPAQRVNVPPRKKTHRQHEKSHVAAPIGDVLEVTSDEGGEALRRPGASTSVAELRKV